MKDYEVNYNITGSIIIKADNKADLRDKFFAMNPFTLWDNCTGGFKIDDIVEVDADE